MQPQNALENNTTSWKTNTAVVLGAWLGFSIATFAMGICFSHLAGSFMIVNALMVALYLTVIVLCVRRIVLQLPVAALMLLVPIAPLAILLLVVTLLPVIQQLC